MVVELEFTAFNTEPGHGTLTILDNDGTVLSNERSGDCLPPKMWSRTNVVHLRFVTSYRTRTGWSAKWTSVAPTGYHSNDTDDGKKMSPIFASFVSIFILKEAKK